MRIAMLGPLAVHDHDRPVAVGGPMLRALLVRLAVDADRVAAADTLVADLWGEGVGGEARAALQTLVSRLRRALGDAGGVVVSAASGYRLTVAPDAVDVRRFSRLAATGRAALAEGATGRAADALDEALGCWRGPALADIPAVPFTGPLLVRLTEERLAAVENRAEAYLAAGRAVEITADLDAAAAEAPLRERLCALRMRTLAAVGRQADALAAYEATRRALDDELGILPSAELREAHLAVVRGEVRPAPGPAPATVVDAPRPERASPPDGADVDAETTACETAPGDRPRRRTNLRTRLTSFIGREREVDRVVKLLADHRLVTVTGPGGAGKTSLAVAAAERLVGQMPDGTWFVALAPVADPQEVAWAVITALGVGGPSVLDARSAATDAQRRLVGIIGDAEVLLVIDNCEHLVATTAALVDRLLGACPGLRVLATSREPLGVGGEQLVPLAPLDLPERGAGPVQALASPAVRLFADRACAVQPDFVVDEDTVGAVVEICRRLDGLPLAIELAAARLRMLTVEQIAERLEDRFRLLTGGSRTALPRHQTLRAVVEWSWHLLEDAERVLARRLSVFPAGATLDAVEDVCGAADGAVFDQLGALVDKSLVVAVDPVEGDHQMRYRMLETVRAYALERLAVSGEAEAVREAFARHLSRRLDSMEPLLRGPEQVRVMRRLSAERDNVTAALRWAVDSGHGEIAIRLVTGMGWFWTMSGEHTEGAYWVEAALACANRSGMTADSLPAHVWAQAFIYNALNAMALGRNELAQELFDTAITARDKVDRREWHPALALAEPMAMAILTRPIDPIELEVFDAAINRDMANADAWTAGTLMLISGEIRYNAGDRRCLENFLRARSHYEQAGDRWGIAVTAGSIAEQMACQGDVAGSIRELEHAVVLLGEMGTFEDTMLLRTFLAAKRIAVGDLDGAERDLREATRTQTSFALSATPAAVLRYHEGELARARGDIAAARARYRESLDRLDAQDQAPAADGATFETPEDPLRALILSGMTLAAVADGDGRDIERQAVRAVAAAVSARDMPVTARVAEALADAALGAGDPTLAAELLGLAAGVRGLEDLGSPDRQRVEDGARAVLGANAYEAAKERGRGLDRVVAMDRLSRVARSGLWHRAAG